MHQIDHPSEFIPVSRVRVQSAAGPAFADGALWRSMRYDGAGPSSGKTLTQHVYTDAEARRIRFVGLLPNGREGELETCLDLLLDPPRMELYQRRRDTRERVALETPREEAERSVRATLALARASQAEADDPTCVGIKA